ncbi:MAG: metallophosphoesterase [Opitutales bacterium]
MKILAVGDLHYNLKQFDWLLQVAAQSDCLILAGDLLDIAGHVDISTQILVVSKYLDKLRDQARLFVCSGNHDGDRKNADGEYVASWLQDVQDETLRADGSSFDCDEWHFTICPWWDGPVTREAVDAFLQAEAHKAKQNWFLINHAPPSASPTSWTGKRDVGDPHLRRFIQTHQPQIVLCGHVHNAPFRQGGSWNDRIGESWVFNAGRQLGGLPTCLTIDLGIQEVQWLSLAGHEAIQLDRPDTAHTPAPAAPAT